MKKFVLLNLFFFWAFCYAHQMKAMQPSDSCSYVIKGKILDADTKQPIPFATVLVKSKQQGAVADNNGLFLLDNLCEREYTLICSNIGYKSITHHHDPYHEAPVIYLASTVSELETAIVEGEAIVGGLESIAINQIDKSELVAHSTQSLASAVGEIQGVTFTSTGSNIQTPVIHGLRGNRILIINNGVKHGFQNWGTDHAPEIDVSGADNISVLKGASGVKFGPEALGGVIIVGGDRLDLSKKLHGQVASGYQSNGKGYYTNASLGGGSEKISYHLGGNYQRIGDRHTPDYSLTNTGMEERSFNAGFRYHLHQWDFKVYYSYVDQNLGLLRSSVAESGDLFTRSINADRPLVIRDFSYDINEPNQNTDHHLATLTVNWYSDLGKLTFLLGRQINLRKEFDVRRNADLPIIDLELNSTDARLEWAHPSFKNLEGTIGLQFFSQNNDNNPGTQTTPFIPNYNTNRFSGFIIESIQNGSNTFEFGLRLDHENNSARGRETNQEIFRNKYSFTNLTASLGLIRELSPNWKLRTNLGSAWRSPNVAELYSFGQQGFKAQFGLWRYTNESGRLRTNRVLTEEDGVAEPEKGYKWINEFTHQKERYSFKLTTYAHLINNYIFERPLAVIGTFRGPLPAFIIDQTDAVFAGVDATYSQNFSKSLKGIIGVSYLWSKNVSKDEPLINQPPTNINADLSWQTPLFIKLNFSKLTLKTAYNFRQSQAPRTVTPEQLISGEIEILPDSEIFDLRDAPEGYFLTDIRWEWKRGKLGGQLAVKNVFNTSYRDYLNQIRYFADEPGRNFLFNINYNF